MRLPLQALTALVLIAPMVGCEDIDSSDVRTDGIYAEFEVTADGDGESLVRAALRAGGGLSNTYLELDDGDRLVAYVDDEANRLRARGNDAGHVWYTAVVPIDAMGTVFNIAFERRSDVGDDALDSEVRMPPPFEIVAPEKDDRVAIGDESIGIAWDRIASDAIEVEVRGDCIIDEFFDVEEDVGELRIPAGALRWRGDESSACRGEIEIVRTRRGEIDRSFGEGGRIVARQRRTVTVVFAR